MLDKINTTKKWGRCLYIIYGLWVVLALSFCVIGTVALNMNFFMKNISKVVHGVQKTSPEIIMKSINDGSIEYQGRVVEFYGIMDRRVFPDTITLETNDENIWFYIDTDEKRKIGHELYISKEKYRFKLYIESITYSNDEKKFTVHGEMTK